MKALLLLLLLVLPAGAMFWPRYWPVQVMQVEFHRPAPKFRTGPQGLRPAAKVPGRVWLTAGTAPRPKADFSKIPMKDIAATVEHIIRLMDGMQADLDAEKLLNKEKAGAIHGLNAGIVKLQGDIDAQRAWGLAQEKEKLAAKSEAAVQRKWKWRWFWTSAGLGAVLAVMLWLKFKP